jgi:mercuric ion transport protein
MWKRSLAVLPGVGVSLLPKLACPLCWPAYAGLLSALGLGFLISAKYLLPLTVAVLAIAATALGFRASRRRGYGPFWLVLVAATVILTGKFYFDAAPATYAGVGLLIAASVWKSWPRRAVVAEGKLYGRWQLLLLPAAGCSPSI